MSFGQAIKSAFSQYATFTGRARRSEYWWFSLFYVLVSLPFQILFFALYIAAFAPVLESIDADGQYSEIVFDDINWGLFVVGFIPMLVVSLVFLLPSIAVLVRRLHDTGRSGWWWLINFVPGGSIVILVFAVLDGQPYDNEYGPDPKAGERYSGPGPGYGQPQPYAQPGYPPQPPARSFPPPPTGPSAQPPVNPDDPFASPGR